jgi:nitroreductase
MDLVEIINKRRSVRTFSDQDVSDELLHELICLARRCPSAGAIRGYEAIITREKIAYNAPVYVVICINPEKYSKRYGDRGRDLYSLQDSAIFGAYLQLLLVNRGLSSVWVGAFRENKIARIIGTSLKPIAIICIGYKVEENV